MELRKSFPRVEGGEGRVIGSAENRANSASIELGLGLSLAIENGREILFLRFVFLNLKAFSFTKVCSILAKFKILNSRFFLVNIVILIVLTDSSMNIFGCVGPCGVTF